MFIVIHSDTLKTKTGKEVKDALGKVRSGWFILEDGRVGGIYQDKDAAVKGAESTASFRVVGGRIPAVKVID